MSVIGFTGLRTIQGNVVRDLAAVNKVEVLPWDCWGLVDVAHEDLTGVDLDLLDTAAATTARGGPLADLRRLHQEHPGLRTPASVRSLTTYAGERTVTLRT